MKRFAATVAVVAVAVCTALAGSAGLAHAAPQNTTSITLSCDKNVDATVSLRLQPSASDNTSLGEVNIACGSIAGRRNRVEVPTGATSAAWVTITSWTNSTDTTPNACATAAAVPAKNSCTNDAGVGSQLIVR